jgi:hypothetical protein
MPTRYAAFAFLLACSSASTPAPPSNPTGAGGANDASTGANASVSAGNGGASASASAGSGGAGGATQGLTASPGASTGAIRVTANIQWDNIPAMHLGNAQVIVQDMAFNQLGDAMVKITPLGGAPLTAVSAASPGIYNVALTSLSAAYDVSVTHAQGTRTGVRLLAPAEHTLTLSGAPAAATALSVTWTPSGDPQVTIDVRVQCTTPLVDWIASSADSGFDAVDTGAFTIPAEAFPSSGMYEIAVVRGTQTADSMGFVGLVTLTTAVFATL